MQSLAGVDPRSSGAVADSASFAIKGGSAEGSISVQFDQQKNDRCYFGIPTTHRRLIQDELSRLDSPEQKIEDLEDERVPAVKHGVAGRAGGDGEEEIKEMGLGKGADELAL